MSIFLEENALSFSRVDHLPPPSSLPAFVLFLSLAKEKIYTHVNKSRKTNNQL